MDVARSIKCVVRKKERIFRLKGLLKRNVAYTFVFLERINIKRGCANFGENVLCCNTTPIPFLIERKTWVVR